VVRSISRFVGVDDRPGGPRAPMAKNRFVTFRFRKLRGSIRRLPGPLRRVATRLNVRYSSYPPMPPQVRAELLERFAEPNEALAAWLGRDLTAWSK
jgi:hypothetical protein